MNNNEQPISMNPFTMLGYMFRTVSKFIVHTEKYIDVYGKGADLCLELADDKAEDIRKRRAERRASINVIEAQPAETKQLT